MGSRFIRKVRTASGAIAVQIVEKNGRTVIGIEHLGSANTDEDLAVLLASAKERLLPGQDTLDFSVEQKPVAMGDLPTCVVPNALVTTTKLRKHFFQRRVLTVVATP